MSQKVKTRRSLVIFVIAALLGSCAFLSCGAWTAMGVHPEGDRRARMLKSQQYDTKDEVFTNALGHTTPELTNVISRAWNNEAQSAPESDLPRSPALAHRLAAPIEEGLRITWIGHSTMLIEIEGRRFLTDPIFSERASPFEYLGPKRFIPPAIELANLPTIDAVLISHDHYDHLDMETIVALNKRDVPFYTPLGVGAHLEYWGVDPSRIIEMDWWEETDIEGILVACLPSRHFSGRGVFDRNKTLWSSWAMIGDARRVYFSGDTAMTPDFLKIGERYGPFDIAMLESGAYDQLWSDSHLGPEQAVDAFVMVRGRLMVPIHWGTFDLAFHGWSEPAERLLKAAKTRGVHLVIPETGASVTPSSPATVEAWWPHAPWKNADQAPVVSTNLPNIVLPETLLPLSTKRPK